MKQVIVTGFQPFGDYKFNPTEDSTKDFDGKEIGEYKVTGIVLPCTYYGAFDILKQAIKEIKPVAILSTGLSSNIMGIRFERYGRNFMNGKYPDADGLNPKGVSILEGGKPYVTTNSNPTQLANLLRDENIKSMISIDAEEYICNSLIYLTTNHIKKHKLGIKNAFIHTPWTETYKSEVELGPDKRTISQSTLHDSIEIIIRNLEGK